MKRGNALEFVRRQLQSGGRSGRSPTPMRWRLAVGGRGGRVLGVPWEARVNPSVTGRWEAPEGSGERSRQAGCWPRIEVAVGQLVWKPSYILTTIMVLLPILLECWPYLTMTTNFKSWNSWVKWCGLFPCLLAYYQILSWSLFFGGGNKKI